MHPTLPPLPVPFEAEPPAVADLPLPPAQPLLPDLPLPALPAQEIASQEAGFILERSRLPSPLLADEALAVPLPLERPAPSEPVRPLVGPQQPVRIVPLAASERAPAGQE